MILNKLNLWPLLSVIAIVFVIITFKYRKKYYYFTGRYFFKGATKKSLISYIFTMLACGTLMISLMDLRGRPERIDSSIPDQKTIIIIDASASMLAEDVRPNRFQKSLLMARHFIKNAVGHQISLVLFSDSQRKLVPFTDDIDLLDAKVSGLEGMNISTGGSNISLAINESLQYFKEDEGSVDISQGNILVFTDSEENDDTIQIKVPDTVNVAFVGVGTLSGGPIPLRGKDGGFRGYKTFNGERVITKLNESSLKDLQKQVKNFKYWIVQSYNIPTDEILQFFKAKFQSTLSKGTSIVQPVEIRYTLLPFYLFLLIAVIFRQGRGLKHLIFALMLIPLGMNGLRAQEIAVEESKEILEIKKKLASDSENETLYMQLAAQYLREKNAQKADLIYKERIDDPSKFGVNDLINSGTAQLLKGEFSQAIDTFKYIEKNKDINEEQRNVVRNNIINAQAEIDKKKKEEKQKKEEEQKEKEEEKEEKQDQPQKGEEQDKDKKDQKGKGQNQKSEQKKPSKDSEDKEKKEKKKSEEDKNENEDENEDRKEKEEKPKSLDEKEEEIKKKRKMVKIPAALKQILDDDKNLQKRTLERIRNSKDGDRSRKDW